MENPVSWTKAHVVIDDALHAFEVSEKSGLIGGSEVNYVYHALKNAGYLLPEGSERAYPNNDWNALRNHQKNRETR